MQLNMNTGDKIQVIMAVVTALGIIIAIDSSRTQLKTFNDQLRLNFFADYTRRYQEIMMSLPENINEPGFEFEQLEKDTRSQAMKSMRAYFNLCSEEFHLAREEHIDAAVWAMWSAGMSHAMTKKSFQDVWRTIQKDTMFDPRFKQWMEEQMEKKRIATGAELALGG
ncbi:hypothetical protein [Opitutus terrae]|uniref:Uncharacterized protein n=1 Tax=Opitutus terrae (strain DSM 11246 / JCM 15787 / PB90-1) TaxID=452637 RepID=B1ZRC0_OPITP|nr:hypothetical protein [Opitutus terrae]ACB74607.1 conserved hypothetical protein [Opitutus terrae PB90-1]